MFKRPVVTNIPEAAIAKWSHELLSEGFVPFPKKFIRTLSKVFAEPSYQKLQLVLAIVDYMRPNSRNPPSIEYLAFVAGISPERCKFLLQELSDAGLLHYEGHDIALTMDLTGLRNAIQMKSQESEKAS